jgi:hypothetical protein
MLPLLLCTSTAWGQDNTSQALLPAQKSWSMSLATTTNTGLNEFSDREKTFDNDLELSLGTKITPKYSLSFLLAGNKAFNGEREFSLYDSSVSQSYKFGTFGDISLSGSHKLIVPTSEQSNDIQLLRMGTSLAPKMSYSPKQITGLTISYTPSAQLNLHQYKVALDGSSNNQWLLSQALSIQYSFTDQLALEFYGRQRRAYTYEGNQKDSYLFVQSLYYTLNDQWELSLGHSQGGNVLGPNGVDTDVSLFDKRSSTLSFGLTLSL